MFANNMFGEFSVSIYEIHTVIRSPIKESSSEMPPPVFASTPPTWSFLRMHPNTYHTHTRMALFMDPFYTQSVILRVLRWMSTFIQSRQHLLG